MDELSTFNFKLSLKRTADHNAVKKAMSFLAHDLLLYDRIYIPTHDLSFTEHLVDQLGLDNFLEVLESNTIEFQRIRGLIGMHVQTGSQPDKRNLVFLRLESSKKKQVPPEKELPFYETSRALEYIYSKKFPHDSTAKNAIIDNIIQHTAYVDFGDFSAIERESYLDILGDPGLKGQMKKWQQRTKQSESHFYELLMKIAQINFDLTVASNSMATCIYPTDQAIALLGNKISRSRQNKDLEKAMLYLYELKNIPDIREAIANNFLKLSDIWKMRISRESQQFRNWLKKKNPDDAEEFILSFKNSISDKSLVNKLPVRIIRSGVVQGTKEFLPAIGATIGVATGTYTDNEIIAGSLGILGSLIGNFLASNLEELESAFLKKFIRPYSPVVYFDYLKRSILN